MEIVEYPYGTETPKSVLENNLKKKKRGGGGSQCPETGNEQVFALSRPEAIPPPTSLQAPHTQINPVYKLDLVYKLRPSCATGHSKWNCSTILNFYNMEFEARYKIADWI